MKYNSNIINPLSGYEQLIYIKPTITNPNIIVGEHSYYSGSDFQSCVSHHYDFYDDQLIVGKFCQIGSNIEIIMNGANHQMACPSTYPFYIFKQATSWDQNVPALADMPFKGNTIIGNDVWIGQNVTIMPGVKIGDGAIIAANSTVTNNIDPYTINGGNPCHQIKKRFSDRIIKLLLDFKWWDQSPEIINELIPILSNNNIEELEENLLKFKTKETDTTQE